MLNAIFGGGDKAKPKAAQAAKRPAKPAIYAAGADVGAGFRALAALNRKGA